MAQLVAGFGSSHSPMLACQVEDWIEGAFLGRDRSRQFVDFDGNSCRYTDLLERAPADAAERIASPLLRQRHANVQAAIVRLRDDIAAARLNALIVIGDDQEELFDHTNMPAIGVYYGETIGNARSAEAKTPLDRARMRFQEATADVNYPCHAPLARHLIDSLQADNFDLSAMSKTAPGKFEGHAISYVHRFLMTSVPIPVVPVFLNAYYPPNQPAPSRCLALGEAIGRAINSFEPGVRIEVLASGGLSHFLVDEAFDHAVIDAFKNHDRAFFNSAPLHKLMSGSSEIRNWICLAGAVAPLDLDWVSYTPGYRTPALTGTGLCFASFPAACRIMKAGTAISILAQPGRPDAALYHEHLAMGDLAEPLGFDSLFALEHHFTGYSMSPAPLQLLSYYAGRTHKITLGTCVIVLPWHDPIRVAEQIALLDILSGGRTLMGFGRGAATAEYEGFRIPMGEARGRFLESAQLIIKALSEETFEWQGEFYQIPRTAIRPRPISHPERRFHASAVSPESAELMAKLGFGMLIVMQNEWPKAAEDVHRYRAITQSVGHTPKPPIILTNVACAPSRDEAREWATRYLGEKWDSIDNHYHFSDGHLSAVKGYESYGKLAKTYTKMKDPGFRSKATDFYVSIQIAGTPDDCIQQIAELRRLTGMDHLVTEFSYESMPHHLAERNMRLFAGEVLPVLQRDAAFQGEIEPAPMAAADEADRMFAPA